MGADDPVAVLPGDRGLKPNNKAWSVDKLLVKLTEEAVLSLRAKNEWGPRNRDRLVFRASELGDVAAYRDAFGEPGGCARKVFFSFWADQYAARPLTAQALMNFEKGNEEEATMRKYLVEAKLLAEEQVRVGAWGTCKGTDGNGTTFYCEDPAKPRCSVPSFVHGDRRYPDRSRGLARGKVDFVINHPVYGRIPLEWKSCSSYIFGTIRKVGPKGDNACQAHFYGHEMGTEYVALGYVNKESGEIVIHTAKTDNALIEAVLDRAVVLRDNIKMGIMPPMPDGVYRPTDYYVRVWPCYSYGTKKKTVNACAFFEHCHGKLPEAKDSLTGPPKAWGARRAPAAKKSGKSFSFAA